VEARMNHTALPCWGAAAHKILLVHAAFICSIRKSIFITKVYTSMNNNGMRLKG